MIIPSKISRLDHRRVVVTGLGVVSSLGIGWQEFWRNLIAGKSGISRVTSFDTSQYERHYAGEVKNFDPTQFMNQGKDEKIGRTSQLAISASKLAIEDAGLKIDRARRNTLGIIIGTTMGESRVIEKIIENRIKIKEMDANALLALTYPANSIPTNVANELNLEGENIVFANACAAGNYAIGYAFDLIHTGKKDAMLAGGADALSRIAFTGFGRLFAMASEKCQPFDKNRKGMLTGEGAGIILVEEYDHARKRKARIYAEILGYGMSCDAKNMTIPSVEGISKAIKKSLLNSKIDRQLVDYISAHGTGTTENDKEECAALRKVFGDYTKKIPVSSIKSMLGHTMGAASALEAIACCLAIYKQEVPPTINYYEKDPDCDIDCVPNKGRKHTVKVALNNSQAFGGNNACLVFGLLTND